MHVLIIHYRTFHPIRCVQFFCAVGIGGRNADISIYSRHTMNWKGKDNFRPILSPINPGTIFLGQELISNYVLRLSQSALPFLAKCPHLGCTKRIRRDFKVFKGILVGLARSAAHFFTQINFSLPFYPTSPYLPNFHFLFPQKCHLLIVRPFVYSTTSPFPSHFIW